MTLVELIEDQGANAGERGILDHLAQQDAFGFEFDLSRGAGHVLETNLVPDFPSQFNAQLLRHPRSQEPRCQPPRLKDNGTSPFEQSVIPQHLWNLRRLSRSGRRLKNQTACRSECRNDFLLNLINR